MPDTTVAQSIKEKTCTYRDDTFESLIQKLASEQTSQSLLSFIGPYMPNKTDTVRNLANKKGLDIKHHSFQELVDKNTPVTRQNMDEAFRNVDPEQDLLYFTNGANLCGNYMGNTFSKVKYATPEERHFLQHVERFNGITVVTIRSDDAADEMIKRKSRAIIEFPLPSSLLKRIGWKLRNYTFHGYRLPDERTEIT